MALALLTKLCPKGATSIGLMCLELGLALKNIRTDLKPGLVKAAGQLALRRTGVRGTQLTPLFLPWTTVI
jgi:hypothetical protein